MKLVRLPVELDKEMSHPTRVRGLKRWMRDGDLKTVRVAPHAGAWIETRDAHEIIVAVEYVAPHAGAWIET